MKFSKIKECSELKEYLDSEKRLDNCQYISHYTNYKKLLSILHSKRFYLSKANRMNDRLEYNNGNKDIWDRLYFTSFIMSKRENIGMWSVYARPWEDGIKISIPVESFMKLLDSTLSLQIVNDDDSLSPNYEYKDEHLNIYFSAVAYTNCDSKESKTEKETLTWNSVKNENFVCVSKEKELTGYIKDTAWSYEKEIRLKALFDKPHSHRKLALNIESILSDMILVTGPLFEGSLGQRLLSDTEEYDERSFVINSSIFQNRFIL